MATIVKRLGKKGVSFRAVCRVHNITRTKTFKKHAAAKRWGLETDNLLTKQEIDGRGESLGAILRWYREEIVEKRPYKTKIPAHLRRLERDHGQATLGDCTPEWWVETARGMTCSGPSRKRYLGLITSAMKASEIIRHSNIDWPGYRRGMAMLKTLGLVRKSKNRDRRTTDAELQLVKDKIKSALPIADLIDFAVDGCMRSAEICRLTWPDFDEAAKMIWVRDRKHPTQKIGNDWHVPLLGRCAAIIQKQTRPTADAKEQRIFPFESGSLEAAFRRARQDAGVEGLRFHDLRHEGISRLFEAGYQIQEVCMVSGHLDWDSLKIYTQLRPRSLHAGPISLQIANAKATSK